MLMTHETTAEDFASERECASVHTVSEFGTAMAHETNAEDLTIARGSESLQTARTTMIYGTTAHDLTTARESGSLHTAVRYANNIIATTPTELLDILLKTCPIVDSISKDNSSECEDTQNTTQVE
ncbi:hypothetical protein KIN20_007052 [Parelaphostrongylus tenuis]|uniref:Uncharacterized protein n=1 Tax=Parelaphostrongylus tenuis TaxID=148309 RepID=A0AAD5QLM4_PARTN|nr:hypothetical protein KIN20_007052 [Parelaphostrongylus tenuis]